VALVSQRREVPGNRENNREFQFLYLTTDARIHAEIEFISDLSP
jgi:hypothetical protein